MTRNGRNGSTPFRGTSSKRHGSLFSFTLADIKMTDSTARFSDRVSDYIKYRPHYPPQIVNILEHELKINGKKIIADIGSGTGISSQPFLKKGYLVYGVEPNREMRQAAETLLKQHPNFISIDGTAEQTNLQTHSIDVIFCGQAFHWFDKEKCKPEFWRILSNNGNVVLAWNERSTKSAFQQEYEQLLLNNIEEYKLVNHRNVDKKTIVDFFSPKKINHLILDNRQFLNPEGLKGRLLSSSYCPKQGPVYIKLMKAVDVLFDKYQANGLIEFSYETKLYWG